MLIVQKWVKCFSFLLVDKLLWLLTTSSGLPTSIVSESLGSYEKLAQAVVGGITLGPRWGLAGWDTPPPLSLALAKLKLGFWFQSLNWKSDLKFSCSGKGFAWDFRMEKGDYCVTFTDNSRSTKNECLVCRYFLRQIPFPQKHFFQEDCLLVLNFTALL